MDALSEALLEPRAYPHPADPVRLVETHISRVFLAGEFAYKVKKPVSLGFLDFSTLASRRRFCFEELRVNRRFAPALYLDVVAITGAPPCVRMAGEGRAIEYAVRMQRFPEGALLAERVAAGAVPAALWRRLGEDIARLHESLPRSGRDDAFCLGVPERLRDAIAQNVRQLRGCLREREDVAALNALEDATWAAWRRHELLLRARYEAGCVRECHGDLHLGNIVVLDGRALPFDAIEFDPALRWCDQLNEMAFLLMDACARGAPQGGWTALDAWLERTGDHEGLALLGLFAAYRATVRAKVTLLAAERALQPGPAVLAAYRRYAALAAGWLAPRAPFLAITCGVSGSGKSTLAAGLAAELGAIRLRADVERKRLFGLAPEADTRAPGMPDIYTAAAGAATFGRLEQLAGGVLEAGLPVIVDATFIRRSLRERFRALATRKGVPFHVLHCDAEEPELRRRVAARQAAGGDASEADLAVLASQLAAAEPPDPATEAGTLAAGPDAQAAVARLARILGAAAAP